MLGKLTRACLAFPGPSVAPLAPAPGVPIPHPLVLPSPSPAPVATLVAPAANITAPSPAPIVAPAGNLTTPSSAPSVAPSPAVSGPYCAEFSDFFSEVRLCLASGRGLSFINHDTLLTVIVPAQLSSIAWHL